MNLFIDVVYYTSTNISKSYIKQTRPTLKIPIINTIIQPKMQ